LKFSEVTIDATTGSLTLRAIVPNPNEILMPGLFVHASLSVGDKQALLIPQRATTRNPDGSLSVWSVDKNNKAQKRTVKVGEAYQDHWIVVDGLTAGETIIVEGYQKIAPNSDVVPSPWKADGETATKAPIKETPQEK